MPSKKIIQKEKALFEKFNEFFPKGDYEERQYRAKANAIMIMALDLGVCGASEKMKEKKK